MSAKKCIENFQNTNTKIKDFTNKQDQRTISIAAATLPFSCLPLLPIS